MWLSLETTSDTPRAGLDGFLKFFRDIKLTAKFVHLTVTEGNATLIGSLFSQAWLQQDLRTIGIWKMVSSRVMATYFIYLYPLLLLWLWSCSCFSCVLVTLKLVCFVERRLIIGCNRSFAGWYMNRKVKKERRRKGKRKSKTEAIGQPGGGGTVFNPSVSEAELGGSPGSRSAWFTDQVPGQLGQHKEISLEKQKQTCRKAKEKEGELLTNSYKKLSSHLEKITTFHLPKEK